jgi:hypothetical protein
MLLNLSNHPSANWDERQMEATQAYGGVKDIAFPRINPEADAAEINTLAKKYTLDIRQRLSQTSDKQNAVHVMGELSFCHALVNKLQANGITCLVSTTVRNATENDGKRISTFRFVKFRTYV